MRRYIFYVSIKSSDPLVSEDRRLRSSRADFAMNVFFYTDRILRRHSRSALNVGYNIIFSVF